MQMLEPLTLCPGILLSPFIVPNYLIGSLWLCTDTGRNTGHCQPRCEPQYGIKFNSHQNGACRLLQSPAQPWRLMKICIKAKRWSEMGDFSQIKDPFTKNKRGPEKRRDAPRGWNKSKTKARVWGGERGRSDTNQFIFLLYDSPNSVSISV